MPVTDFSGDDDWLQSLMANTGASAPYGPSGYPDNLPRMRYGPPGGGLIGMPGATPGGPSMGYPAMGSQPAASPGPAQGLSLTNNPIANWLRNNVSVGAPNFANISPDAVRDFNAARAGVGRLFGGGAAAAPAATTTSPPGGRRTDAAYGPYDDPNAPDPVGDYAARVGNYGSWPTTAPRPAVGSPGPSIANAPLPPRRPSSFGGQAPGAGAPQGTPSQTPRPASKSSSRFGTVQYQVPGAGPLSRNPIYTTLNLFGGR